MKSQFLLLLSFLALSLTTPLFKLDLSNGLSQFEDFQAGESSAKVIDDELSDEKALTFEELSIYSGIVMTDWIESESQDYYINIDYRGTEGKRTGAFLGYITKEDQYTVQPIALDNDQKMDPYQQYQFFETANGNWQTYQFYKRGPEGIKIILEKGMYYGIEENYDMAFKKLKIYEYTFPDTDCTASEKDKILTSMYFGQVFKDQNFNGSVQPEFVDNGEEVDIKFKFPDYQVGCVLSSLFAQDSTGKAIELFKPTETIESGLKVLKQTVTLSDLNDYNCYEEEFECNDNKECLKYTCNISLHFYLDYGKEFSTRADEYEWVNENSYAIFRSQFTVQVNKETQTVFNTLVQTLVNNQICGDRCKLDMSLELALKVKYKEDDEKYVVPMDVNTIIWGERVYFQITSQPTDYSLDLMDVYVQTGDQTGDEYTQLGDIFISSFIENIEKDEGVTTFSMRMSGEAGLTEGKPFNVKFLMKSDPVGRRMLEEIEYPSNEQQTAQITQDATKFVANSEVTTKNAVKISVGLIALLLFCLML